MTWPRRSTFRCRRRDSAYAHIEDIANYVGQTVTLRG